MQVGPWGAWCRPTIGRPRIAPASARVTRLHGFSGATPVPRCSFFARCRARTVWFLALIGSGRDAFGFPEPLVAEALRPEADVAAVCAGVAFWSSAADGPASAPAAVVGLSGFDADPPHAVSAATQQTTSRAR